MVSSERKGPQLLSGPRRPPHPALRVGCSGGGSRSVSFISACVTQERQEGKGDGGLTSRVLVGFSRCKCVCS